MRPAFLIVFLKEFRETLRDRRALWLLVLFTLMYPLMLGYMLNQQIVRATKSEREGMELAVIGAAQAPNLMAQFKQRNITVQPTGPMDETAIAELLGMQDILERRAKGFSQGQRIKVALARTLLHKPRHLLLDEPSRGLDVMSTRALRTALTALRQEGCCVIMATHVMQEVTHLCEDVIVIAKGHTVAQGSPAELCRRTGIASLEDAFVSLVGTEEGIAA